MFIRGALASLEEGASVAGVHKTTVRHWLKAQRIDWLARRAHYLANHRRKALELEDGKRRRKPTKPQMHGIADRAKREWDAKNGGRQ